MGYRATTAIRTRRFVALAVVAAAAVLASGCGSQDEPAARGNPVDRAFVREMVPHHRSAIAMARVAQRRGTSSYVRGLARDVVRSQGAEVAELRAEDRGLAAKGVAVGELGASMAAMDSMEGDTAALERADPFDPAFLRMMLPHHTGAVEMARIELARGADPELKALAERIIAAQEREIRGMRDAL